MSRWIPVLFLLSSGCSRWAYGPTWKGVDEGDGIKLVFDGRPTCGELTVVNQTELPVRVAWSKVKTRTPKGDERPTWTFAVEGQGEPADAEPIPPRGRRTGGICTNQRPFEVHPRPPTGYDFALGWFFGMGVLAGNVAWEPDQEKARRKVDQPRAYGFELLVSIRDEEGSQDLVLPVRGDGAGAFKYTPRVHGEPEPMERYLRRKGDRDGPG